MSRELASDEYHYRRRESMLDQLRPNLVEDTQMNSLDPLDEYGVTCYCKGSCPGNVPEGTCRIKRGAKCFAAAKRLLDPLTNEYYTEETYGCLAPEGQSIFQCRGIQVLHENPIVIECCSDKDGCNKELSPQLLVKPELSDQSNNLFGLSLNFSATIALIVIAGIFVIGVALLAFCYLSFKKSQDRKHISRKARNRNRDADNSNQSTLQDLIERSTSGNSVPLLTQRTIAKQTNLHTFIGSGRYGNVYIGSWRREEVAVKVFKATAEDSWSREIDIYQTGFVRHDNILGYIAADIKGGISSSPEHWLITPYYKNKSLFHYLSQKEISIDEMLQFSYTILSGLFFLHTEIPGSQGKPGIAHCDLSSKCILVKDDMSCCISDFGMAVKYESLNDELDVYKKSDRVATLRYMAPEILDKVFNKKSFAAYLNADVYSVGLILWEIGRRTKTSEKEISSDEYRLPYFEYVRDDPTYTEMHDIVCKKEARPHFNEKWKSSPTLQAMSKIIQGCWHENPATRLSSLRIKKMIQEIIDPELSKLNEISPV